MALRGDERGEINGPGIIRATEFREKAAGRSERRGDICGRSGVDGSPDWFWEGRRGEEMLLSNCLGLASRSRDCQGFSSRGESGFSISLIDRGVERFGVRGSELEPSACGFDERLDDLSTPALPLPLDLCRLLCPAVSRAVVSS